MELYMVFVPFITFVHYGVCVDFELPCLEFVRMVLLPILCLVSFHRDFTSLFRLVMLLFCFCFFRGRGRGWVLS